MRQWAAGSASGSTDQRRSGEGLDGQRPAPLLTGDGYWHACVSDRAASELTACTLTPDGARMHARSVRGDLRGNNV
jgi:hypothetical protein